MFNTSKSEENKYSCIYCYWKFTWKAIWHHILISIKMLILLNQ